ncbi:hypothetical protein [Sinosporangium siamense]|nr:hypothetical protein [Sinosporangium siamense]
MPGGRFLPFPGFPDDEVTGLTRRRRRPPGVLPHAVVSPLHLLKRITAIETPLTTDAAGLTVTPTSVHIRTPRAERQAARRRGAATVTTPRRHTQGRRLYAPGAAR